MDTWFKIHATEEILNDILSLQNDDIAIEITSNSQAGQKGFFPLDIPSLTISAASLSALALFINKLYNLIRDRGAAEITIASKDGSIMKFKKDMTTEEFEEICKKLK